MGKKKQWSFWSQVWLLGMIGQLCWNVKNQWFNTFIYAKIAKEPTIISWMLPISALASGVSTVLFGCISDRKGNRRHFISIGYILWGVFTILFGTIEFLGKGDRETMSLIGAAVAAVTVSAIMSFFGSMGNYVGFNAWINDNLNAENAGSLGAALAVQPVLGTIIGTLAGGFLIGTEDNYMRLFLVIGGSSILVGILSIFLVKDENSLKPSITGTFSEQLFSIFNFRELLKQRELLFVNLMLTVFFISFNIYYVYLGNVMIYYLGFSAQAMGIMQGLVMMIAVFSTIPAIQMIKKDKSSLLILISVLINAAGLIIFGFFVTPDNVNTATILNPHVLAGILLISVGYLVFFQTITVWSKRLFPEGARGQFEGLRIIFYSLIPMIIAPLISNPLIKRSGEYINEYGIKEYLPTNKLFIAGLFIVVFTLIPLWFADQEHRRNRSSAG